MIMTRHRHLSGTFFGKVTTSRRSPPSETDVAEALRRKGDQDVRIGIVYVGRVRRVAENKEVLFLPLFSPFPLSSSHISRSPLDGQMMDLSTLGGILMRPEVELVGV
jgi:hypothetical protein